MTDIDQAFAALRGAKPAPATVAFSLDAFRDDFALVWQHWIECNEETGAAFRAAGQWVKTNLHDRPLIEATAAHFRQMASELRASAERDRERAARIRNEVRAERAARKQKGLH